MKTLWCGVMIIGLVLLVGCARNSSGKPTNTSRVDEPTASTLNTSADLAWDFDLTTLEGKQAQLHDFQGQWVFLNFWATWCKPCITEMPALQAIAETYEGRVVLLGINVLEEPTDITPFIETHQITYPILLTNTPAGHTALGKYEGLAVPHSYLIAPDGTIAWHHIGALSLENMTDTLAVFIEE
jgi:thiol-disulfide isomerase/thioredoxin